MIGPTCLENQKLICAGSLLEASDVTPQMGVERGIIKEKKHVPRVCEDKCANSESSTPIFLFSSEGYALVMQNSTRASSNQLKPNLMDSRQDFDCDGRNVSIER